MEQINDYAARINPCVYNDDQFVNKITDEYGNEILVLSTLSFPAMTLFSNSIYRLCIDEDSASYSPELFDFAVRMYTVEAYTNIVLPHDEPEIVYNILYRTNIFQLVCSNIDKDQFAHAVGAAQEKLKFTCDIFKSAAVKKCDDLLKRVSEITDGYHEFIEYMTSADFKEGLESLNSIVKNGSIVKKRVSKKKAVTTDAGKDTVV